jgi:hypothetical protein
VFNDAQLLNKRRIEQFNLKLNQPSLSYKFPAKFTVKVKISKRCNDGVSIELRLPMQRLAILLVATFPLLTTPATAQTVTLPTACFNRTSNYLANAAMIQLCADMVDQQRYQQSQPVYSTPGSTVRTSPYATELQQGTLVTRRDDINLRSGNSITSAVIGNLNSGTTLYVMDAVPSKDGDSTFWRWVRVESGEHQGKYGYVREDLI